MKNTLLITAKKSLTVLSVFCLLSGNTKAQSLQWATNMGAPAVNNASNKVISDASGNVLTVGFFTGATDFSPGAGTFTMAPGGTSINGFVQKLSTTGAFVWAKGFLGTGACNARAVANDATGNVYIAGNFSGSIDFDPGAGVSTLTTSAATDDDIFICKLSSAGAFVWAKRIGSTFDDNANAITLDASNNVFVGGDLSAGGGSVVAVDLDPSAAVVNYTTNATDGFVLKLDNAGNYLTAKIFGSFYNDYLYDLETDATGNVFVCGKHTNRVEAFWASIDGYNQAYVGKLTNTLANVWAIRTTNTGATFQEHAVAKSIEVDAAGNVYYAGEFLNWGNSIDFDPSTTATVVLPQIASLYSAFLSKLSPTGTLIWVKNIAEAATNSSTNGDAVFYDMSIDGSNNLLCAGTFSGAADFDPAGSYVKTSAGARDYYVTKIDQNGLFYDVQTYGSTGEDRGYGIKAVGTTAYYVAGVFTGTVDFSSSITTSTIAAIGASDAFVAKYAPCSEPAIATAVTPSLITICAQTNTILSVTPVGGVTMNWYNAAGGGTLLGSGNTYTTANITTTTSLWAEATNTCGAAARIKFTINTLAAPVVGITASSSTLCSGSTITLTATGATSYTWNTGPTTTVIAVSPTITTAYTVTGTGANSCKDTQTITATVSTPTVNVTASSTTLCSGTTTSLTASGASTYSWSTGATTIVIAVTPTITTVYTATGTSVAGCKDTQTISISVSTTPTVNVTASSPSICSGSSSSLTASGASTYSWSTGATTTVIAVSPTITTVYTATGTSAAGCKDTQTLSLSVTTTPTLSTSNYTICAGGTATLSAAGATTYSWSTGATTTSITVTPTANASYTVTGSNGLCNDVNTVSVTVGSALSIAVTPTAPSICAGNSGTMTVSGATSYTWSTGSNSTSIVVSPTISTTYTISGTSGACSGTRTISMVVNPNPTVTATSSSSLICTGNTASLTASGASTYVWNPGSLPGAIVAVSPTLTTTYSVVGTSAAGCTNTKTVSVTVSACTGLNETQQVNGSINIYPNPNNGEFTLIVPEQGMYSIINSIGQIIEIINVKEDSQTISVQGLADGIYYVIGKTSKAKIVVSK